MKEQPEPFDDFSRFQSDILYFKIWFYNIFILFRIALESSFGHLEGKYCFIPWGCHFHRMKLLKRFFFQVWELLCLGAVIKIHIVYSFWIIFGRKVNIHYRFYSRDERPLLTKFLTITRPQWLSSYHIHAGVYQKSNEFGCYR